MKKTSLLVLGFLGLTAVACGKPDSNGVKPVEKDPHTLTVNYSYADGTELESLKQEVELKQGESYSFASPAINFMKADKETVEGTMPDEDLTIDVVYDYSLEDTGPLTDNQKFDKFMIDLDRGLSISYLIDGNNNDWNPIFHTDSVIIYNTVLRYKMVVEPEEEDGDVTEVLYDWYPLEGAELSNGASWNSLLTDSDHEIYITYNFDPATGLTCYRDGVLLYTWRNALINSNKAGNGNNEIAMSALIDAFLTEVSTKGFAVDASVGWKARRLSVGYAMDAEETKARFDRFQALEINYKDDRGNAARPSALHYGLEGEAFEFDVPAMTGNVADKEKITGVYGTDKEATVTYSFDGEEKLTAPIVLEGAEWPGGTWSTHITPYLENMSGDFTIQVVLNNKTTVAEKAEDTCWRSVLWVWEDASTKDSCTQRMDWWGWMDDRNGDGQQIGSGQNNGGPYAGFDYGRDLVKVFADMDIVATISRKGTTITNNMMIYPKAEAYAGISYSYTQSVSGIDENKVLNLCVSCELTKVTITSVKLQTPVA